jgi:cyclic pyranopterin phosphate synthase
MMLIDQYQRRIRKLRISLTDKCNLRCHYCMPVNQQFMSESHYLKPSQYFEVLEELHNLGVEELRITGGEPLIRKNCSEILIEVSKISWKKIGLTTNGILLDKYFDLLKAANVNHLNISLDSLDVTTFNKITHGNYFYKVIENIQNATKLNFDVKINMVVMRGINHHEINNFIKLAEELKLQVRFLEIMKIGSALQKQNDQYIPASEMIQEIKKSYQLTPLKTLDDSTSFDFTTHTGARIGFIASESAPFCNHCSRWRLSADGILRACLFKEDGIKLDLDNKEIRHEMYRSLLRMKPILRAAEVTHQMNTIGG